MLARALLAPILVGLGGTSLLAQTIAIRTVPISQSHQFDLFPSFGRAMGDVSIATRDSLADPFANPAKGSRIGSARFFASPGLYLATQGLGAGRTLPVGVLARSGPWFGGVALAAQQIDLSDRFGFGFGTVCPACESQGIDFSTTDRSRGNGYAYAMLGRSFPKSGLSLGGSVLWGGLAGLHGVDLLYAGSARIEQQGDALDLRLSALKEWGPDRSLSALLVHNRYQATHDVLYLDQFWDPGIQQNAQRPRFEHNLDRSSLWGLHLEYVHPLNDSGWRLGWIATTNLMSHPKIPNYSIQNIPRDPGNSEAFNFGFGLSKTTPRSVFGVDAIFEPIRSHTWADSDRPTETANGGVIPPGGKTIENRFRFSNSMLKMGFAQEFPYDQSTKALTLRLGLWFHNVSYALDQRDNIRLTSRRLNEQWTEWAPTWGLSLRFSGFEIHYRGSAPGTGWPSLGGGDDVTITEPSPNILAAPAAPLNLNDMRVVAHQFAISVPIR